MLGLVVSKENKVSEFRHEWINALREDIAEFIAQSQELHVAIVEYASGRVKDYREYLQQTREQLIALNRAATRTRLRLNQAERNNEQLMKSMGQLKDFLQELPEDIKSFSDKFSPLSVDVEKNAAIVLAREWKRVKQGESGYRGAKLLAYLALILSFAAAVLLSRVHVG